jgi:2-iminobutanoate/2-iminopropanoate deaminase
MRAYRTDAAPGETGPFSQAIESGDKIYTSGQGPIDPETGEVPTQDPQKQTMLTLDNLEAVLEEAGVGLDDVVKANIYVTDMDIYEEMNEAYASRFEEPYPARSCVEVSDLPVDILVEIELVAERPDT